MLWPEPKQTGFGRHSITGCIKGRRPQEKIQTAFEHLFDNAAITRETMFMQQSKANDTPQGIAANPQGKGRVPVLDSLNEFRAPRTSANQNPVSTVEALSAYLVSRIVLCASFRFRVNPGRSYYLYSKHHQLRLSLIAPQEWGTQDFGEPLGKCFMRKDNTWQIELASSPEVFDILRETLKRERTRLLKDLTPDATLDSTLPDHDVRLPFNRRVLANGLAQTTRAALKRDVKRPLSEMFKQAALTSGDNSLLSLAAYLE